MTTPLEAQFKEHQMDTTLARVLVRSIIRRLYVGTAFLIVIGVAFWVLHRDAQVVVILGGAITALSFVLGYVALRNDLVWSVALRHPQAATSLSSLASATTRELTKHHLFVAAVGTVIGFAGDLIVYLFQR